jgi:antitoxin MazE
MHTHVKKWGNSAAIRLPISLLSAAHLSLEQEVTLTMDGGRIMIEPKINPEFKLDALINGITENNKHEAISEGTPAGKEIW